MILYALRYKKNGKLVRMDVSRVPKEKGQKGIDRFRVELLPPLPELMNFPLIFTTESVDIAKNARERFLNFRQSSFTRPYNEMSPDDLEVVEFTEGCIILNDNKPR